MQRNNLWDRTVYYDRKGNPIDNLEWRQLFEQTDRVVAHDNIEGCRVSTVWIGLDHGLFGDKPEIFETMIFDKTNRNGWDGWYTRYSTEEEAIDGHEKAVFVVKVGLSLPDSP